MKAKLEVEMPIGCYDCQFCAGTECGAVEGMPTIDLFGEEGLRPKWCPLIPEEIMDGKLLTGWIPVSERMPEAAELESCGDEVTPVLITYLGYYDREPHEGGLVIWCEDNTWRWHDETLDVSMMDVVKVEITAWMPLPEPYRP